jgi:hypothetical protein
MDALENALGLTMRLVCGPGARATRAKVVSERRAIYSPVAWPFRKISESAKLQHHCLQGAPLLMRHAARSAARTSPAHPLRLPAFAVQDARLPARSRPALNRRRLASQDLRTQSGPNFSTAACKDRLTNWSCSAASPSNVLQRIHFGLPPSPLSMPGSQPRRARSLSARLAARSPASSRELTQIETRRLSTW